MAPVRVVGRATLVSARVVKRVAVVPVRITRNVIDRNRCHNHFYYEGCDDGYAYSPTLESPEALKSFDGSKVSESRASGLKHPDRLMEKVPVVESVIAKATKRLDDSEIDALLK